MSGKVTESRRQEQPGERERVKEEKAVKSERGREVLLGAGGWSWTSVEERPSRLEDLY